MNRKPFFSILRLALPLAAVGLVLAILFLTATSPAWAALGWVGDMFPVGGSTTTIAPGASFDVYVQVYKAGVTDPVGQGANIECYLHWGRLPYWGGPWGEAMDTPMVYNVDKTNNDEYRTTITPTTGLYEFTAYCVDTTDQDVEWQGMGNGRLAVDANDGGCNNAAQGNNNIYWAPVLHDSFSSAYRNPTGPVASDQVSVTLELRTCMNDLGQAPRLRVWDDRLNVETFYTMTLDLQEHDGALGSISQWKYDLNIPADPTILYYVFRLQDGSSTAFYRDDNTRFYGGGYGQMTGDQNEAYGSSYQLTVYDPNFQSPEWMQRGIVYQIFPDRFRDGQTANDPAEGRFFYNTPGGSIQRSDFPYTGGTNNPDKDWNFTICDPRNAQGNGYNCSGKYGENFYGGDLAGITQKIEQGYFDNLGVSVLYLNPIFWAPSNHKYDTTNYLMIDPDFGTLADFQALAAAAEAHGMQLVLDGVFNHTSSDSAYFDRYLRFDAAGNLISPGGIGTDDDSGACEAGASPFYPWFYFPDIGNPGQDGGVTVYCNNGAGNAQQTYEAWYGYSSLPKLQANLPAVRSLIWAAGLNSVGPYWVSQGAAGWRFDVGGDVDPGLANDPANDYWEGFRAAVRDAGVTGRDDTLMLGEEWGDASAWLLGNEWDSVMNYRFRSALLSWFMEACDPGPGG